MLLYHIHLQSGLRTGMQWILETKTNTTMVDSLVLEAFFPLKSWMYVYFGIILRNSGG